MPARLISRTVDLAAEPGELFLRLAAAAPGGDGAGVSFLDSSLPHERLGRFSILAWRPAETLSCRGRRGLLVSAAGTVELEGDPFDLLRERLRARRRAAPAGGGRFTTGAIGYLAYDLGRFIERLPARLPDEAGLPELHFAFHDAALVYDHRARRWTAWAADSREGRVSAEENLERLLHEAAAAASAAAAAAAAPAPEAHPGARLAERHFPREEYERAVARAVEYITAGDIFQVNLAQRFSARWRAGAVRLYAALRRTNPAPFAAFLGLGEGRAVLSSSPERFLHLDERSRLVEPRPIKGTRPRGATPEEDARLARELLASAKDLAELTMIVDLERNDLGRVGEYGSVRVVERAALESYARVHHLVATVTGKLRSECDETDLLRAAFPGGSVTGAPKVRAMEIIEELERCRRSVYTGAIGYVADDGAVDLNVAIRTMIHLPGRVSYQVGGGIVADSDPAAEYQETLDKGRALAEALREACAPRAEVPAR